MADIGSTTATLENRVRWHLSHIAKTATWNSDFADFLRKGIPQYQALAVVPDSERHIAERDITRLLRKRHKLLNILDGQAHSEESRRRMRAAHARRRARA